VLRRPFSTFVHLPVLPAGQPDQGLMPLFSF
jgi:hypothetical protein